MFERAKLRARRALGQVRRRVLPPRLPAHVNAGRHTYGLFGSRFVRPTATSPVIVGAFCSVANGVSFLADCYHRTDRVSTFPLRTVMLHPEEGNVDAFGRGSIRVGNDVWIGENATIMSGVSIGDGAVVGACAVVAHDVPPYAIVVGVPARVVRKRFPEPIIGALLRIRWWEWSDDQIRAAEKDLYGSVEHFVEKYDPERT